jgi:hypothetical protein
VDSHTLDLAYLVTPPKSLNLLSDPKIVIGDARAFILLQIMESLEIDCGDWIEATSLEGAVEFYQKMGFKGKGHLSLSPLCCDGFIR